MEHDPPMTQWLRAILAAIRRTSAPDQQPEAEQGTNKTKEDKKGSDNADEHLEHDRPESAEDGEEQGSEDSFSEDEETPEASPRRNATPVQSNGFISAVCRVVADKATALIAQARDAVIITIEKVKRLRVMSVAKTVGAWIKQHPWEAAVILVPLVALLSSAIALLAIGFGTGGIVAGSTAAAIQAGIGNVVVGSIFATCTSAMMGGYGAGIIFGGVWVGSTALMVGLATVWKRWKSQSQRAMVLPGNGAPLKAVAEKVKRAASDAMFLTMFAAAYAVYRWKRWYRGL